MSFHEKRALVSILSNVIVTALYSAVMAGRYPGGSAYSAETFHFWGVFFVVLIPVSIFGKIIIHILFSISTTLITHEEEPAITDERDSLISLRAYRNALIVFSLGLIVAMGSLALDRPPTVMFVLLIGAGVASEIVADLSEFYFYRQGG